MTIANWIPIEGDFYFEFNTLEEAVEEMKRTYMNKIYIKVTHKGSRDRTDCILCYFMDDNYNLVAGLDFDGTVKFAK